MRSPESSQDLNGKTALAAGDRRGVSGAGARLPIPPPQRGRSRRLRALVLLVLLSFAAACAGKRAPQSASSVRNYRETGIASWYGKPFHGRRTASGEVYNMHKLTAAHRTLPFGVRVRVTNLENHRTVVVRITDRGPFKKGRIIDLSLAAARKLNMVKDGVVKVKIAVVR